MRALSWRGKIWSFEYVGDILLQLSGGELGPGHALRVRGWGKHDSWCLMFALLRSGSSRRFSPSKLRYSSISSYSSSTSHASASAGALYTWGNGSGGSLGYDMSNSQVGEVQRTPQKVLLADGSSPPWTQVRARHTLLGASSDSSTGCLCACCGVRLRVATL